MKKHPILTSLQDAIIEHELIPSAEKLDQEQLLAYWLLQDVRDWVIEMEILNEQSIEEIDKLAAQTFSQVELEGLQKVFDDFQPGIIPQPGESDDACDNHE